MRLPRYVEIPSDHLADALLERGGELVPLRLHFDPRDVRATHPMPGALGAPEPVHIPADVVRTVAAVAPAAASVGRIAAQIGPAIAAVERAKRPSALEIISRTLAEGFEASLAADRPDDETLRDLRASLAANSPPDAETLRALRQIGEPGQTVGTGSAPVFYEPTPGRDPHKPNKG